MHLGWWYIENQYCVTNSDTHWCRLFLRVPKLQQKSPSVFSALHFLKG